MKKNQKYKAWLTPHENGMPSRLCVVYKITNEDDSYTMKAIPAANIGGLYSEAYVENGTHGFRLWAALGENADPDIINQAPTKIDIGDFPSAKDLKSAKNAIYRAMGKGQLLISRAQGVAFGAVGFVIGMIVVAMSSQISESSLPSSFAGLTPQELAILSQNPALLSPNPELSMDKDGAPQDDDLYDSPPVSSKPKPPSVEDSVVLSPEILKKSALLEDVKKSLEGESSGPQEFGGKLDFSEDKSSLNLAAVKLSKEMFGFSSNPSKDGEPDFYVYSDPGCPSCMNHYSTMLKDGSFNYKVIPVGVLGQGSGQSSTYSLCSEGDQYQVYGEVMKDPSIAQKKGSELAKTDEGYKKLVECAQKVVMNEQAFLTIGLQFVPSVIHPKTGSLFSGTEDDVSALKTWIELENNKAKGGG